MSDKINSPQESKECSEFRNNIAGRILKTGEHLREMSYADLLREWLIWLHSDSPSFSGNRGEICFLHGNVSYIYDSETNFRKKAEEFQNNARKKDQIFRGNKIFSDTPIFLPLISSFYSVSETYSYDGKALESIADCLFVCRRDMQEGGPMWFTIQKKGCTEVDLKSYARYVESPSFKLTVTKNSPLRNYFEMPIAPGEYDTVTTAYVAIIKNLPPGEYRFRYGGIGRAGYSSDSVHDFIVKPVEGEFGELKVTHDGYEQFKPPSHEDELGEL